jgi:hypothetical protein
MICRIFKFVLEYLFNKIEKGMDWNKFLLSSERIKKSATKINEAGCPSTKCWGFVDGTLHPICRPKGPYERQRSFFNGRKKIHGVQFQVITMADGMLFVSRGFPGVTHDARMFNDSNSHETLEQLDYPSDDGTDGTFYHIFGDKGYNNRRRLVSAFQGNLLTNEEASFNNQMSTLRVSVENIIAKQRNLFRFIDYKKNQKIQQGGVIQQYIVSMFLVNCHSCIYGNQVSSFF